MLSLAQRAGISTLENMHKTPKGCLTEPLGAILVLTPAGTRTPSLAIRDRAWLTGWCSESMMTSMDGQPYAFDYDSERRARRDDSPVQVAAGRHSECYLVGEARRSQLSGDQDRSRLHIQAVQNRRAVPILLDRDPLHIDPCRRQVPVSKRVLRLDDAPRGLAHPLGKRVARLVQMKASGTCPARIFWHLNDQARALGRGTTSS